MQQIPESSVSGWVQDGQRDHPSLVDWSCPACSRLVSLSVGPWKHLSGPNWYAPANCPGCRSSIQLFTFNVGTGRQSLCGGTLFMYPAARIRTPSLAVLENPELSQPLKNAYKSAVNVVNTKEWNAAAVMCRRLLEGIAKTVLPVEIQAQALAKQLELLPQHRDLAKPLLELAHAVRKGGNLGAHFSLEKEPDEQIATMMLELCEDLLEYLFTLPVRIEDLHKKIETLSLSEREGEE